MKLFIACLGTETNTFSPIPTGEETFRETMLFRGDGSRHPQGFGAGPLAVWRAAGEEAGMQVVESLCAFAQPAGITARSVYEGFRDEILKDLEAAMPVDVVLTMHGAMVADGYDDCEGDLLNRVRGLVGAETVVGLELDLHCSVTPRMIACTDTIVTFKEYPHIDASERAAELFRICRDQAQGQIQPVMGIYDTRMISMWRTPVEPMKSFVARMQSLEGQDGILSISFAHGFPWGDVEHVTARVLVVTDGDQPKAQMLAKRLGREIWELRHDTAPRSLTMDEALDRAVVASQGPVVLADVSDNAGGGAPADSTFLLQRILERDIGGALSGLYWDPIAVRFCCEAGEGATLDLRVGGKCGPMSGTPVDLRVTVRRIVEEADQQFSTNRASMGTSVWVSTDRVDLILISTRTQTFHPDAFEQFGIRLDDYPIVAVKSTQHFYAGFAPVAAEILYVAAPGAIYPDFAQIPYRKLKTPFWPRVENPFAD